MSYRNLPDIGKYVFHAALSGTLSETSRMPQVYEKDGRDIKGAFLVRPSSRKSTIFAIAVSKDSSKNQRAKILCHSCVPIAGFKYNKVSDQYMVRCLGYCALGTVDISYSVAARGSLDWEVQVPMPPQVVRRYLRHEQRVALREFQDQFSEESGEVSFEFVQMILAD